MIPFPLGEVHKYADPNKCDDATHDKHPENGVVHDSRLLSLLPGKNNVESNVGPKHQQDLHDNKLRKNDTKSGNDWRETKRTKTWQSSHHGENVDDKPIPLDVMPHRRGAAATLALSHPLRQPKTPVVTPSNTTPPDLAARFPPGAHVLDQHRPEDEQEAPSSQKR